MQYSDLPLANEEFKLEKALTEQKNLLVEAPTGSGKSLFVPYFLSKHCKGRVVVLEPRRIAALALAEFSAKLNGETCGKTIGYQFRQESLKSESTRILFQTYGNFLQELLHGKLDADWVVFDEYHERKADMDLLFSYLLKTDVHIAVMSAALNRNELENALAVKCLSLGTPLYPVQIINQNPNGGFITASNLEAEVIKGLKTLYRNNIWKTTLVFLPGKAEISKCHSAALEALGSNCAEFLELYGGQDKNIQNKIFENCETPRVIFTTNIAETSITVPNVSGVIDSGIERVSLYDDSEKVNVLRTLPIAMQNAIQRSGRSGRTQNGCAIRLWNAEFEKRMNQGIVPEVTLIEPTEFLLQKFALENSLNLTLPLPTKIPEDREISAKAILNNLGLVAENKITELGLKTIRMPISDVKLALILAEANSKEDLPDLLLSALAIIHSGSEFLQKNKNPLNILEFAKDILNKNTNVPKEILFTLKQLFDFKKQLKSLATPHANSTLKNEEDFVVKKLLKPFADFVATFSGSAYKMPNQNMIRLPVECDAIIALTMVRTQANSLAGSKSELKINLYAPVKKELLSLGNLNTRYELLWKNNQERFVGVEILENNGVEISRKEILTQEASPKVLKQLKELTPKAWKDKIEKENWKGKFFTADILTEILKMKLAAKLYPEYGFAEFNSEDFELIFDEFTSGIFLLRDLEESRYKNIVEDYFGKNMLSFLNKTFPDYYQLPNGKKAKYSYQQVVEDENFKGKVAQSIDGILVEISARIEDFMELKGEHFIAQNKLKVRYDILAPNFRTIQKTWDLTSFWQNTYAEVRKELRGRYPKHPWPEKVL